VCAEWSYSAAFGFLLFSKPQVNTLFMLEAMAVILMTMSCFVSEPGCYLMLPLCWALMGWDVSIWASYLLGLLNMGLSRRNKCSLFGIGAPQKTT
jgi:hypothetical protein